LEVVIEIARSHGIPIIVDGSLINYPFERLKECLAMGVDIIVTSGGKHIFGPAGTGFLCGRKELVEACRMQCGPEYGIGRPMKVGKEEMIGLITAIENYLKRDPESEHRIWEEIVHYLAIELGEFPYIEVTTTESDEVDRPVPRACLRLDEKRMGHDAQEIVNLLRAGDPPLWVQEFDLDKGIIILNPVCLMDGDKELVIKAFRNGWHSLDLL
jgi:D-glucosaminate-6-phosphate ammonia-lyase